MAASQLPMMRRRGVGMLLRKLREQKNLTLDQVAAAMECSPSKISRIETGNSSVGPRDVRDLLGIYGISGQAATDLMEMAREARQLARERSWWHPYGNILVGAYVGNESAARRICTYEHQLVPGLLQSEDYARATLELVDGESQPEKVSDRLRVRMARQSLLVRQDDPLTFEVVLDEAVLCRPVGGEEVMRAQMRRLCEAIQMPNVTVQLLPFSVGAHPAMEGTFAILDFSDSDGQSVVYAENATGGLFLEKAREVEFYRKIYASVQDLALSPGESTRRIAYLAEEGTWTRN